jgi:hypothetical protein
MFVSWVDCFLFLIARYRRRARRRSSKWILVLLISSLQFCLVKTNVRFVLWKTPHKFFLQIFISTNKNITGLIHIVAMLPVTVVMILSHYSMYRPVVKWHFMLISISTRSKNANVDKDWIASLVSYTPQSPFSKTSWHDHQYTWIENTSQHG